MTGPLRRLAAPLCAALLLAAPQAAQARRPAVAPVPPMGWNSWNTFGCAVTEADIRRAAQAIVASGMQAAGYRYVVVDDCWFHPHRAPDGSLRADPVKFPSGIAALAAYVHGLGLKFGIYEAPRERTCAQDGTAAATGSLGHEVQDARTFAAWGVDYLKYDWCSREGTLADQIATFRTMRDALRATHRPIVYSINPNSLHETTGPAYDWSKVANLWRTTQDVIPVWDREPWNTALAGSFDFDGIVNAVDETAPLAGRVRPDHFNDPDMLVVGTQAGPFLAALFGDVPSSRTHALTAVSLSPTVQEMRSQFSMWAMLAAPLMAGNDPSAMSAEARAILVNREVIAVDQDPLGVPGRPVRLESDQEVWAKPLAGGAVAVAFLNRGVLPATMTVGAQTAGLAPAAGYAVRDLWTKAESASSGQLSAQVAGHGVTLLRVTPR